MGDWIDGPPPQEPVNKHWLVHRDEWVHARIASYSAGDWWICGDRYFLKFDRHAELLRPPEVAD